VRPPRPDIAAPPLPPGIEWIGDPIDSIDHLLAARPVLVHFFDFAQLNSVRVMPYLAAWHDRYANDLAMIGVHSPRYPFTGDPSLVADALPRLGIDWPVALDSRMAIWRDYDPHGWPALFLWGQGGALRWYQLGEGEYAETEEAIREAISLVSDGRSWPPPLEPLRPTDVPGATVIAPTAEMFPGGSIEQPLRGPSAAPLAVDYQAGGAYAVTAGAGQLRIWLDDGAPRVVDAPHPGLQELVAHQRHTRGTLQVEVGEGIDLYALSFAPGVP
jgi:hypothetical protein